MNSACGELEVMVMGSNSPEAEFVSAVRPSNRAAQALVSVLLIERRVEKVVGVQPLSPQAGEVPVIVGNE